MDEEMAREMSKADGEKGETGGKPTKKPARRKRKGRFKLSDKPKGGIGKQAQKEAKEREAKEASEAEEVSEINAAQEAEEEEEVEEAAALKKATTPAARARRRRADRTPPNFISVKGGGGIALVDDAFGSADEGDSDNPDDSEDDKPLISRFSHKLESKRQDGDTTPAGPGGAQMVQMPESGDDDGDLEEMDEGASGGEKATGAHVDIEEEEEAVDYEISEEDQ